MAPRNQFKYRIYVKHQFGDSSSTTSRRSSQEKNAPTRFSTTTKDLQQDFLHLRRSYHQLRKCQVKPYDVCGPTHFCRGIGQLQWSVFPLYRIPHTRSKGKRSVGSRFRHRMRHDADPGSSGAIRHYDMPSMSQNSCTRSPRI